MNERAFPPEAVFARTCEPQALPVALRLRALEWALLFAATGRHTAAELGRRMGVEAAARDAALARLLNDGLIAECDLDAAEYVRALAASGDVEEKSLREFLMIAAQPEVPADAVPQPAELPDPEPPPWIEVASAALSLAPSLPPSPPAPVETRNSATPVPATAPTGPLRLDRPPRPAFGFKPLPTPNQEPRESQPMPGTRRLSLRALMNLIERQAGSREAGQLDIYRVFVRVDTLLLRRNGIDTLRFTEDRLVADPELEQAIVGSVKKTLGLVCPESVWVDAA